MRRIRLGLSTTAFLLISTGAALAQFPNCIAPVDNPPLSPGAGGVYPPDPAIPYNNGETKWSTDGLVINVSVNKTAPKQFIAQGMNYAPTQIGGSADFPPFNDFFYDNDVNTWQPLWNRDIELLRALGVNSIRTYGMWKWEPGFNKGGPPDGVAAYWKQLNFSAAEADENNKQFCIDPENPKDPKNYAFQHPTHVPFLDRLWNKGNNPIYVWIGISVPLTLVDPGFPQPRRDALLQFYLYTAKWLAKKYGDHPAVIGFVVGNEVDTAGTTPNSIFWQVVNNLHDIVKASAPDKLTMFTFHDTDDYNRPITTGIYQGKRGPEVYEPDVWGFNPYTNPELDGSLFSRFRDNIVKNCTTTFLTPCAKPLLYGEFGVPANTHKVQGDESYPIPWVAPNFVWMDNPPAAQCLSQQALVSPPGSGGDGPEKEFKRGKTIAVELPAKGKKYRMPDHLVPFFKRNGVNASANLMAEDQAIWIQKFWNVTKRHKAKNGSPDSEMDYSSGGYLFEWRDEWWKANPHPEFHSITGNNRCGPGCKGGCDTGAANAVFPGGWGDEQWFGVVGAQVAKGRDPKVVIDPTNGKLKGGPDILTPRAAVVAVCAMYNSGCLTPIPPSGR